MSWSGQTITRRPLGRVLATTSEPIAPFLGVDGAVCRGWADAGGASVKRAATRAAGNRNLASRLRWAILRNTASGSSVGSTSLVPGPVSVTRRPSGPIVNGNRRRPRTARSPAVDATTPQEEELHADHARDRLRDPGRRHAVRPDHPGSGRGGRRRGRRND